MGLQYDLFPDLLFINSKHKEPKKSLKDVEHFLKSRPKGFSTDEMIREVLLHIKIEDAIKEWLEQIENKATQKTYGRAMKSIFYGDDEDSPLKSFIKSESSIMELDQNYSSVGFYNAIQELPVSEYKKKVYRAAFSSFCNYIRTITWGTIDAEPTLKQQDERNRVCEIFEDVDWNIFMSSLEDPFKLIAEITFEVAFTHEYRLRLSDPRHNFLSLSVDQIDFENRTITLKKEQSYHPGMSLMLVNLSEYLIERLKAYIGNRKGTVFLSKRSNHLFPKQVQRAFDKASEKLGHKISPVSLGWAGVIKSKSDRMSESRF